MHSKNNRVRSGFANYLVNLSVNYPRRAISIFLFISISSVFLASSIELKTSNLDLIDEHLPEVQRFLEFTSKFGTPNVLVMVIRGENQKSLKETVDRIAEVLATVSGVKLVLSKIPGDDNSYFTSFDKKQFYLFIQPTDLRSDVNALIPFVSDVKQSINNLSLEQIGVRIGLTGIPQYALDDQKIIQRDISLYSILSLGLVFIIFAVAFKNFYRPVLATITLIVSVIISLGIASIFPGHLTLLSAPFAAMIFGLGIDYGIHIVNDIEGLIDDGLSEVEAIVESLDKLRLALSAASLTTVGVFFVLIFSGFRGFEELGIIAGTGMLLCLFLMYTLFPALLSFFAQRKHKYAINKENKSVFEHFILLIQTGWLPPLLIILSGAIFLTGSPHFDSDYLNLQPSNSEAVRLERSMIKSSEYSPYFAAFTTSSISDVANLTKKLQEEPSVGKIQSVNNINPQLLHSQVNLSPELEAYKGIFIKNNEFATYAYPVGNVWEKKTEKEFLSAMRKIDASVTGMPFIGNLMISRSKQALMTTAKLAALILLVVIILHFKKPLYIILAIFPPLLTVIWMLTVMRLLGINFNPLNVMALPIILGIAVDDSVHIVHRFITEKGDIKKTLCGAGRGVFLTTLTTLAAFGSLSLTSHLGLRSLCLSLSIGVTSALIISVIILPWLLVKSVKF